jgi:hypothetical protein
VILCFVTIKLTPCYSIARQSSKEEGDNVQVFVFILERPTFQRR